jgi:hypothetical protein
MARWLLKKDEPITQPEITLLSEEEIKCAPGGQVMLMDGARSTYDLNRDYEKDLAKRRKKLWATKDHSELLERVRRMASIRKLSDLPKPEVGGAGIIQRDGYQIKKMIIKPEAGIALPALMFIPETNTGPSVLYLHEKGKDVDASSGGPIEKLVKSGRHVLAVDLRGVGETKSDSKRAICEATGVDWKDVFMAYLLGRSYVGMRAEDILVCARLLSQEKDGPVNLISTGNVGVPALHAAALEPALFNSIKLVRSLSSWSSVIESGCSFNQQVNTVHGALKTYDLPNLANVLGDKLTVEEPLDAFGKPL